MREKLERYMAMLTEHNQNHNLTGNDDPDDAWVRHFEDSAQLLLFASFAGARVLDLGSGAGFPGIPLRIGEPNMRLTLLDSTDKKVEFLRLVCDELGLSDVRCVHGRAEEFGVKSGWRDGFDFVTARGVANLNILCELALPLLRIGGKLIAMKENECDLEVKNAAPAVKVLGAELDEVKHYTLSTGLKHAAVIIRKTDLTPQGYPRRWARIKSKPL
ncbi:ribosomal RNA small subunit methyltransferase G [Clostridia bacterium]|nr:ribosomal RNA small subunit methyltransferase G [Clostridia bacterium]